MTRNEPDEPEGGSRETANQELEGRDEELQRGRSNLQPKLQRPRKTVAWQRLSGAAQLPR
jgi:hypothetical protein